MVDKSDAENLLSFCGQGVKKIGPTQFEMTKVEYVPEGNLSVLILKKLEPPVPAPAPVPGQQAAPQAQAPAQSASPKRP